ncbi:LLM class flavin-dependent oxidoreductase [Desertimonas flava]|uniref:LLM class flavin-dependent oxidoreductase n=1 Tax=Desertimonas flava TaxID=2064846 RepID=UPI0019698F0B|nr:LLM class flavin-dependent oxidoreductase [Desertimonas flava]
MTTLRPMRFGVFAAPFHHVSENPTWAFARDIELAVHADRLGFEECWYGEHHSGGTELINAPELMIAAAAQVTNRIRLGTGVSSLPYHNPFMLADRFVQLDHMTMGRVMLGVGPGALPGDAYMMGINPSQQRPRMEECLEAVLALWRGDEPVNMETEWFTLRDAQLQYPAFQPGGIEVAVAATFSPSGPRLAGRFGTGLLSISATQPQAFEALARHWQTAQEVAAAHGTTVERSGWRMVGPMHLAPTMEQARHEVEHGLKEWVDYFLKVGAIPILGELDTSGDLVDAVNDSGVGVIGTPEMAVEQIKRLEEQSEGFGTYMLMMHEWADREATLRSLELFSRWVMPTFRGTTEWMGRSRDYTVENREVFLGEVRAALRTATDNYRAERNERREATAKEQG